LNKFERVEPKENSMSILIVIVDIISY